MKPGRCRNVHSTAPCFIRDALQRDGHGCNTRTGLNRAQTGDAPRPCFALLLATTCMHYEALRALNLGMHGLGAAGRARLVIVIVTVLVVHARASTASSETIRRRAETNATPVLPRIESSTARAQRSPALPGDDPWTPE